MKSSETLRKAKDVLFEQGWTKNTLVDGEGRHCVLGAVMIAKNPNLDLAFGQESEIGDEIDYLCAVLPGGVIKWGSPVGYNDWYERTFDEIIDLLDRAEKVAEREESTQ